MKTQAMKIYGKTENFKKYIQYMETPAIKIYRNPGDEENGYGKPDNKESSETLGKKEHVDTKHK
jgi:hypothetical protein